MSNPLVDRRRWLQAAGAAVLLGGHAALAGTDAPTTLPTAASASRKRTARFAHLTDVHVEPERAADRGMAACLDHVQSQPDKPEFILFGGDCVFDSMAHDAARTNLQWDLWQKVLKDHCSLPVEFGIGNHDVFGWTKAKAKTTGAEPDYGKRMAMDRLGLTSTYHSFDRGGWHFIVLDSIQPQGESYKGMIDEPQFGWLSDDLARVDARTPVVVQTHIPILSVTPMFPPRKPDQPELVVSDGSMHVDFARLRQLFRQHPNVRLALSGHTHLLDRVDSLGVSYVCDGAVSGDWWKGNHLGECEPGYGIVDLYDDGTFDHQYVTYGWKPVPGDDPA
jgi:3',5'-cyclic AMP phosphodiesterase CpdA